VVTILCFHKHNSDAYQVFEEAFYWCQKDVQAALFEIEMNYRNERDLSEQYDNECSGIYSNLVFIYNYNNI
jgi:hypothetical protein